MRYDVTHRHRVYTVTDDRTVVTAAAVTGRLVDETTGEAVRSPGTLRVAHPTMRGKVVDGGWFAISALPEVDLRWLATDPYTIEGSVSVPSFADTDVTFTLPAGTALPLEAGDLPLRRRPVVVAGRVSHNVTGAPLAGALVFASAPVAAQQVLAARWPLRFDHAAGVEVRRRRLDDSATTTVLTSAVRGGQDTLALASRTGIAPGDVLRVGTGEGAVIGVVDSVSAEPADTTLPGTASLTATLHRGFPAGTEARRLVPGVVPQTRTLTVPARAGDGLVLLDGAIAPDGIDTVEVRDPGRLEYLVIGAATGADGYYQLPGVGRVADLRLVARATGLSDAARTIALDYGATTNYVNFRLDP